MAEIESQIVDFDVVDGCPRVDANFQWIQVYDGTLKVQVGDHPPGTKVPIVSFNYEDGELALSWDDENKTEERYKLLLSVGDGITYDGNRNPDSGDEESESGS